MAQDLRGRWMWYELLTSDPKAAIRFYTETLGWGTAPFDGTGVPYTMWTNGGRPIGGVMALADAEGVKGAPPSWLPYVGTNDLDATARTAQRLGGRALMAPKDVPGVGRVAILSDPQGARFALFQPPQPPDQPETAPAIGDMSWHELAATDAVTAAAFYRELFGWDAGDAHDMGPMGTYYMYGRHGQPSIGMFTRPPDMPGPAWWLYTRVANVEQTAQRVKDAGGEIINGPMEVPGGDLIAQGIDPQGAGFAIHQKRSA